MSAWRNPIARDVIDWDDYVGQFEAIQDVTVTPRVSGTIMQILFRNGQDVTEGQPLFIIDPRPYRAAYQQAVAATGRARGVARERAAPSSPARDKLVESGRHQQRRLRPQARHGAHGHDADLAARKAARSCGSPRPRLHHGARCRGRAECPIAA